MAVQAYPYLAITDGVTTVTFADGLGGTTNYPPVRGQWAPQVAGLRKGLMDGLLPYADVTEELQINIRESTAALCLAKLATLAQLLDQAERWWKRAESVNPVTIKYAPQGSTIASTANPFIATVLGRAADDETSGVNLPVDFNDVGMLYEIRDVRVRFIRTGVWTAPSETASAAAVANPAVLSIAMPSAPQIMGPTALGFTGFVTSAAGAIDIPAGYVIFGPNLNLQQAESPFSTSLASGATYVSTADAAARASGGSVGRLNHAAAALNVESAINFVPSLSGTPTSVAVYVTFRNNSNSAWTIRASGGYGLLSAASLTQVFAPTITIPGTATNPTVLYLGTLANRYGIQFVSLNVALTALVGAGTIDFDTIVFVDLSTGEASVISVSGARAALGGAIISEAVTVQITNNPATLNTPEVRLYLAGGNRIPQTYNGPAALNSKGATLKAIWYATHLFGGTTPYWTTQNIAGTAILNVGAGVTRYPGYLTPD